MYFNHAEIEEFCKNGYIKNYDSDCINSASLDIRLGNKILMEKKSPSKVIDYRARDKMEMVEFDLSEKGIVIFPGAFFLANTLEECDFPDDVAALFRCKSTMGRYGLEHMDAGWVDPGFHGTLTLEFKLLNNCHPILLRPGDRIGQLIFIQGLPVDPDKSYRNKGNYNGQTEPKSASYRS